MTSPESKVEENFGDLFTDKNLLSVFKASPTIFANGFNATITMLVAAALLGFSIERYRSHATTAPPMFVSTFALWGNVGWTLSATLLGFLVAGFALLCTVLRPSAVIALHKYYGAGEKANALRSLFISFVDIFITFLSLLIFSLGMVIVTSPGGPSIEIKTLCLHAGTLAPTFVGYLIFICWGTWFAVAALKLKSFVFNLYQALMLGMTESVHSTTECANMVSDKPNLPTNPK